MTETKGTENEGKLYEIRMNLVEFVEKPFFQDNFGSLANPQEIAEKMVYYRDHIDELPSVVSKKMMIEDAQLKLFVITVNFLLKFFSEAWARKYLNDLFRCVLDDSQEIVIDRSLADILKQHQINIFVLRFLTQEQQKDLEIQLNDIHDENTIVDMITIQAFANLNERFRHIDNENIMNNYVRNFVLLTEIVQAYPLERSVHHTIPAPRIFEMTNFELKMFNISPDAHRHACDILKEITQNKQYRAVKI